MASKGVPEEVREVLPTVDGSELGMDDLFIIESEVLDVEPKWKKFGGALNIAQGTLNRIEAEKSTNDERLSKTLEELLKMNYDTKTHGPPSWKLIVQALGHRNGGGDTNLALEVAKAHSTAGNNGGTAASDGGTSSASANPAAASAKPDKAILKATPDMRRLTMITYCVDGTKKKFRPLDKIAPHWENIADFLEVGEAVIADANRQQRRRDAARDVLRSWLGSDVKASWTKLIRAMTSVEQLEVASKEFREALLNIVSDSDDEDD